MHAWPVTLRHILLSNRFWKGYYNMEKYTLCQLREKEVVNLCDGKRLGYIHDAVFNICTASVCAVTVLFDCRVFGFGKCEEIVIPWEKISCFGKDTVLVNLDPACYNKYCEKKFDKK